MDKGDLPKALRRLLILIAKKMGKKLLPSALQDNKLIHILGKGEHMLNDPAQLIDLAIKTVVDISPGSSVKKVYLVSKLLYQVGSVSAVCVTIWMQGGFIGVGTAYIVNKICDEIDKCD